MKYGGTWPILSEAGVGVEVTDIQEFSQLLEGRTWLYGTYGIRETSSSLGKRLGDLSV